MEDIEKEIKKLKAQKAKIKKYQPKQGYETITENLKNKYIKLIDERISNNVYRLNFIKKQSLAEIAVDQMFTQGLSFLGGFYKMPAKIEIPFEKMLQMNINVCERTNVEQLKRPTLIQYTTNDFYVGGRILKRGSICEDKFLSLFEDKIAEDICRRGVESMYFVDYEEGEHGKHNFRIRV
jgi:hypothetical protein